MGLVKRMKAGLRAFAQPNQKEILNKFNEAFLYTTGGGFTQYSPELKTYIELGYNINPIVYSVINQQATKTASIPFSVKKVADKKMMLKHNRLCSLTNYNFTPQQMVRKVYLESKAMEDDEMDFPMEAPNTNQTWKEFLALYKTFLKTTGNVYIYMLTPDDGANKGEPLQVYLLPSHLVEIVVKSNTSLLSTESPVSGYLLVEGNGYIEFDAKDVIHIKYPNPNYGSNGEHLYGMSPLASAVKNIQSSNSALDLNIKTLKSGGAFGLIHGKNIALQKEQADEIKERLLEMDSSPEQLSKIAGVSAEIGFTRLSLTSDELKPFDYLQFDQKQICNVLGWDDKLLNNDDGAKFDNVDFARKRVITDNIIPDLQLLSIALTAKFLPRFKGYENTMLDFDVMDLPEMQTDIAKMSEWLNNALDRGVITRNEYRVAIRYTRSEDEALERFTVASDVLTLDEAIDNEFRVEEVTNEADKKK